MRQRIRVVLVHAPVRDDILICVPLHSYHGGTLYERHMTLKALSGVDVLCCLYQINRLGPKKALTEY